MDLKISSLELTGYKNQPVPNTFLTHPVPSGHLAIVLPGYRYSADMPPLHYAGRVLLEQGADVLSVDYAYYRTDFMKQPESVQDKWMAGDVFAACDAVLSRHSYERITMVGKSLGTIAMGHLLADVRFQQATCVWLTPLLTVDWLSSRIETTRPRSLFVIGTADRYYQPEILKHLERVTSGKSLVLEGVEHSLEIPGNIPQSLQALEQITQAVAQFLG